VIFVRLSIGVFEMAYTDPEKRKAQAKAYYEANKEQINEKRKAYLEATKEQRKAYNKAHQEANNEQINERKRAYYKANKEKQKAQNKAYLEANKEQIKEKIKAYNEATKITKADKITALNMLMLGHTLAEVAATTGKPAFKYRQIADFKDAE
jgi:membrane protein involved in colicin uptake